MECIVCKGEKKYKCPHCRLPYCSLACWTAHKELCKGAANVAEHIPKQKLEQDDEDDINWVRVPLSNLQKMAKSPKLKDNFNHTKLRQVIRKVDGSRNRYKTLRAQMLKDEAFCEFIDKMLEEMGYMKGG